MRIIVLSKAPVPGKVKTRLFPKFTAEQACELHQQMMVKVLEKALLVSADIWLAVDDPLHPFFLALIKGSSIRLINQGQGNLGARLIHLMEQSFAKDCEPVMFLGTDSPHVSTERYLQASHHGQQHDVVIGAVEDGGYDLILIKQPHVGIFQSITWGSSTVLNETLMLCKQFDLSVSILTESFDLDRPEDLERAPLHSW